MKSHASIVAFWPVLLGLVAVDCTTKRLVVASLPPHVPHPVIGDVVRFTLAYNPDAAMGLSLGAYSRIGFAVIALVVLGGLLLNRRRITEGNGARSIAIALIAGGAIGNLIDRVRSSRGVVDFIDVGIGNARFYTFNVADASVFCGAVLLLLLLAGQEKNSKPADARHLDR
ncbi:MAG TPA: signal peptidase II [Gemmatimonadaceae bacterium]|jgi:signal peptidase II|nr:signal peptidase II [Gemmatimonadaceae bacterium]